MKKFLAASAIVSVFLLTLNACAGSRVDCPAYSKQAPAKKPASG